MSHQSLRTHLVTLANPGANVLEQRAAPLGLLVGLTGARKPNHAGRIDQECRSIKNEKI
jgi:hypothetical protein